MSHELLFIPNVGTVLIIIHASIEEMKAKQWKFIHHNRIQITCAQF